jgi:hypothetical protein
MVGRSAECGRKTRLLSTRARSDRSETVRALSRSMVQILLATPRPRQSLTVTTRRLREASDLPAEGYIAAGCQWMNVLA